MQYRNLAKVVGKYLSGNYHVPRLSLGDALLQCPRVGMKRRDLVGREPYVALLFVLEASQAAAVASLHLLTEEVTTVLHGVPVHTLNSHITPMSNSSEFLSQAWVLNIFSLRQGLIYPRLALNLLCSCVWLGL